MTTPLKSFELIFRPQTLPDAKTNSNIAVLSSRLSEIWQH